MLRHEALALYNNSYRNLANALGVTREAIHMWRRHGDVVPEAAYLKLRFILKPDAFYKNGKLKRSAVRMAL